MHTLLPYDDFKLSALALTDELLQRQIEDCLAIVEILHETDKAEGDFDHPTVQAWRGSELQLCEFGLSCVEVYLRRNADAQGALEAEKRLEWHLDLAEGGDMTKPSWYGTDWIHTEYQGLLRFLDPLVYEQRFPNVTTCTPDRFRYPTAA